MPQAPPLTPPVSLTRNGARRSRSRRLRGICRGGIDHWKDAPKARGVRGCAPLEKAAWPLTPPISLTRNGARRSRFLWRWAESNRRPNKAPSGFLHAYPAFDCRGPAAGKRANGPLASNSWGAVEASTPASFLNDTPCTGEGRREPRRDTRRYGPGPRD